MPRVLLTICFSLSVCLCAAQQDSSTNKKFSYVLEQSLQKKSGGDSLLVSISYDQALRNGIRGRIVKSHGKGFITALVKKADLAGLASEQNIRFISIVTTPKEELSTGAFDLSLNRINTAHTKYPFINGNGLTVTVKERLFDTTDIDLKGRVIKTGREHTVPTAHASLMATIISGGANSSPYAKGVAPSSITGSVSFTDLFPEPDTFYRRLNITVQNHSYGTALENFYGNEAAAYDASAYRNSSLLFVFSAGNAGNQTTTGGPYSGVTAYANLTGNYKGAKNVLVVGSQDSSGAVEPLSSRGPAYDGRIKPELVAFGEDGSSGAAALVSGSALLVQQAYGEKQGTLPSSALVKAVLINSADDAGPVNPDYRAGYGSLNTVKAIQTVLDQRVHVDSVQQGTTISLPVTIPDNIALLKATLVWTDPEAPPASGKALVNDLDLRLRNPTTNESWAPWVLSTAPVVDSLQAAARRGNDTLNNAEQVSLETPVGGTYILEVRGTRVAGRQPFAITWQADTAQHFSFTFPTGADPLPGGNTHVVRWDSNIRTGGALDFTIDGTTWKTIASVPDLSVKQVKWTLPDTVSIARLRMRTTVSSGTFLSDSFVISPRLDLQVGFDCIDSFLLYWQNRADRFQLYALGDRYLQPVLQTGDTSFLFYAAQHPSLFYSVAPLTGNRTGLRSNTLHYKAVGTGCYISGFYLQARTVSSANFTAVLGTSFGVAAIRLQKRTQAGFTTIDSGLLHPGLTYHFTDPSLHPGENRYRLQVVLVNGAVLYSGEEILYHVTAAAPVLLYPNPVRGVIRIINNESGRYTVNILDAGGRTVYSRLLTSNLTLVNADRWNKGIYFAWIHDQDGTSSFQKIILE
jgi:hypothetical protein